MKRMSVVTVLVRDQDEAIAFYRDTLGLQLIEDAAFGPERWVTLRAPDDECVSVSLCLATSDDDLRLVGRQAGSRPLFALAVDDCIGEYRRMRALGVAFRGEPEVRPYGTGVVLADLYGNSIYLNEEPVGAR